MWQLKNMFQVATLQINLKHMLSCCYVFNTLTCSSYCGCLALTALLRLFTVTTYSDISNIMHALVCKLQYAYILIQYYLCQWYKLLNVISLKQAGAEIYSILPVCHCQTDLSSVMSHPRVFQKHSFMSISSELNPKLLMDNEKSINECPAHKNIITLITCRSNVKSAAEVRQEAACSL